ncbi:Cas9 inhibitor AcrIIA9 family protein [Alicyclobacillus fastidiosus]|uniref:Cas9 inhibitor AcrIIA9 family protein n=1 Tax=Alicyclobacillus fastidiosus TaxID=392011 RepID=A0ABV5AKF3_9BACL|nr:Cas9 inhibitor AcrIIA9 family protein [Alicyclobacillus fastidiosus]WEH08204.1 Cas9 inhibitor AcrIIA9 family protein [Alicyclobacillus fastidiosus]
MTKQNEAISKVRAELTGNNNNSYVQAVGIFLLQRLEEHPEFAENVLAPGKTILKSLDAMRKVAEKKKVGNCAVLTDAEGFAVILDYFKTPESTQKESVPTQAEKTKKQAEAPKPKEPEEPDDEIDFDALLL